MIAAITVIALLVVLVVVIRLVAKSLYKERRSTRAKVASRESRTAIP